MHKDIKRDNKIMPNYATGKIYKILNSVDDHVYVGSTINTLSRRMAQHRANMKTRTCNMYNHMNVLGHAEFYIELIENYPCDSKEELLAKEGKWIRQIGTLNKQIAGRSQQQYYDDNKDQIAQKIKDFRADNPEEVRAKQR